MNNKCNKKLLASIILAASLSSSFLVNNKVINAAFESYKSEERRNLAKLVQDINGLGKIKEEGNNSIDDEKIFIKDKIELIRKIYYNLLLDLRQILGNREGINSKLKSALQQNGITLELIKDKIERDRRRNSVAFVENIRSVSDFIGKLKSVEGGFFTVWDTKVKTTLLDLSKFLKELKKEKLSLNVLNNGYKLNKCITKVNNNKGENQADESILERAKAFAECNSSSVLSVPFRHLLCDKEDNDEIELLLKYVKMIFNYIGNYIGNDNNDNFENCVNNLMNYLQADENMKDQTICTSSADFAISMLEKSFRGLNSIKDVKFQCKDGIYLLKTVIDNQKYILFFEKETNEENQNFLIYDSGMGTLDLYNVRL